jgi:hypothetical protein
MNAFRIKVALAVLGSAKDVGNQNMIAACRNIINACTFGWRKYGNNAEWRLVQDFWMS